MRWLLGSGAVMLIPAWCSALAAAGCERGEDTPGAASSAAEISSGQCATPVQCVEDCGEAPVPRCSCPAGFFPASECGEKGEGIIAPQY